MNSFIICRFKICLLCTGLFILYEGECRLIKSRLICSGLLYVGLLGPGLLNVVFKTNLPSILDQN